MSTKKNILRPLIQAWIEERPETREISKLYQKIGCTRQNFWQHTAPERYPDIRTFERIRKAMGWGAVKFYSKMGEFIDRGGWSFEER
jgi:hypothetical protein